ncbi:MAG: glycerol-3-phosphate dehydrogenase/oxidase [Candidatus Latescibacteria bacterium]|nr:glycerol-3-phosphate dehydrogenase/oxidase [Candidatus Latescibacterota bacterium]
MERAKMVAQLAERTWDLIVVGGGASGLGVAVDAQARGYRTLLVEQGDFAQGTSSRSTKLVHGGVRYLKQGNVSLVVEALRERGLIFRNAPHLVRDLAFVVPRYRWWEGPFYGVGLKLYDRLAGELQLAPSRLLDPRQTLEQIPNVETHHLLGGVVYHDAQFDDARMALALAQTAAGLGAVVLNYLRVEGLLKGGEMVEGVRVVDGESGHIHEVKGRVVVNATGVFSDGLRRLDEPAGRPLLAPSQGVHLVLDRAFLPGEAAIMVPQTDDGRVLFAIPWQGRVLVGTTDTPVAGPELEPRPLPEEVDFILRNAARYLRRDPTRADILSCFAGQRPLVQGKRAGRATKAVAREHTVLVSPSGLVSILGGKWTTYRRMAQDTVDAAALVAGLPARPCITEELRLHGWAARREGDTGWEDPLHAYGAERPEVEAVLAAHPAWARLLHPRLPYRMGQVVWAARAEMARTLEDVLARRTRSLLLDARASVEAAPAVAGLLAAELGRDEAWARGQVEHYTRLAAGYLPLD